MDHRVSKLVGSESIENACLLKKKGIKPHNFWSKPYYRTLQYLFTAFTGTYTVYLTH